MAAAIAKVLRGARPGFSSQPPIPAIFRRGTQEGVAPLVPRPVSSSPAALADAGVGRLMHTGSGVSSMLPQQALPFGRCGALSHGHNTLSMQQFSSRRSFTSGPEPKGMYVPWFPIAFAFAIGLALSSMGLKK
ncbi:unnamed protein product [Urochloa decumbens]|uniref:Uncharacterized protein n=1 Tax=Urochloa decumbens TaxID=240449 RepID=A0ABC9GEN1_9POAL